MLNRPPIVDRSENLLKLIKKYFSLDSQILKLKSFKFDKIAWKQIHKKYKHTVEL